MEVSIKSKQKGIIARRIVPSFKYYFGDDSVKMPEEHARLLIRNPNFSIVGKDKQEIELPDLDNMDIKELRAFAKQHKLKSKDTSESELREEIIEELKGGN